VFDATNVERAPSEAVDVLRVADAAANFECELCDSLSV
jgi:flavin reductase (DIM6/NTAB) family NADH-FMN oxidoreductase RutF